MKQRPRNVTKSAACLLLLMSFVVLAAAPAQARERVVPPNREAVNFSYAPIVKEALPAVVNVYVRYRAKVARRRNPFMDDPFFRHFFGDNFGIPRERMEASLGSGVIVDPSGLVVTNYHVVEDSSRGDIKVALPNKREYRAKVLLSDKHSDLAVLKLMAPGVRFPFLKIANSDKLEVGDIVLAMGNPFGVGQTVTNGIVSALARTGIGKGDAQYFIQTDAAINPGNSGGALVDMDGELVGINTAIFSKSGGSLGIGFAIPSNMVRLVVNSAKTGRSVRRPWFGGTVANVTRSIAEGLNLDRVGGVYIAGLSDKSPARNAGLQVGDVVLSVNGHDIEDVRAFRYQYTINGIGGLAVIDVLRGGRRLQKTVHLVGAPEIPPRRTTHLSGETPLSGAIVANLSPAVAEELSTSDQEGVVIVDLARRSIARRLGLAKGDIIVSVNDMEIKDVLTLQAVLNRTSDYWRLTIKRGDNILTMSLGG